LPAWAGITTTVVAAATRASANFIDLIFMNMFLFV
jgi:hypothetical protein